MPAFWRASSASETISRVILTFLRISECSFSDFISDHFSRWTDSSSPPTALYTCSAKNGINGAMSLESSSKTNLVVPVALSLSCALSDLKRSRDRRIYQVDRSVTKSLIGRPALLYQIYLDSLSHPD